MTSGAVHERKRTVYGLIDAVALALAIGDAAQAGAGQEADAAGDDAGLVADVAKQVARHDDAIEAPGVFDHDHGRAVDELMLDLEVRELLLKRLRHDLAPQSARGQDIGLVQRPDRLVATSPGQEAGQAGDAPDLLARVGLHVPGLAIAVACARQSRCRR